MQIEVTFLGTGTSQGVPMIGCDCVVCRSTDWRDSRLRSSVLVQVDGVSIVIDTTPDFRYQMLRADVKRVDAVLYTHGHKDHTGGMDDLRAFNYIMKQSVDVYCEERVAQVLRKDFDYAFAKFRYPGVPEIDIHVINDKLFRVNGVDIVPIRGMHYRLPVLGFRIGGFCYLTDMNSIEESEIDKFRGVDVLVINSLRRKEHISHFTLDEALAVIASACPSRAYLTHISHQLGRYEELAECLPVGVEAAVDGMKIVIEG